MSSAELKNMYKLIKAVTLRPLPLKAFNIALFRAI